MRGGPTPWVAFGTAPTTELFAVGIGHAGRSADRPLRAGHKVSVVGDDNWVARQGPVALSDALTRCLLRKQHAHLGVDDGEHYDFDAAERAIGLGFPIRGRLVRRSGHGFLCASSGSWRGSVDILGGSWHCANNLVGQAHEVIE